MEDSADNRAQQLTLLTSVRYLAGVGGRRAEQLARINVRAVRDLLFYFPRDYEDMSRICQVNELRSGVPASVIGQVDEVDQRQTGAGRSMLGVLIRQDGDFLRAVWFSQTFFGPNLRAGRRIMLSGVPKQKGLQWEMFHPKLTMLGDDEEPTGGTILPVYPLTEGITQVQMRRVVDRAVEAGADLVDEVFPEEFLDEHNLLGISDAIRLVHRPTDPATLERARRRFVYQELLVLQLALAERRRQLRLQVEAPILAADARVDARIFRLFPFELTSGQRTAIGEIAQDMGQPTPMNRLLQGDVGSGKTVVAEYAMLLAVAHGHQAVMMAPTEILARQHARTLARDLADSRVRIGLLTGSLSASQRRAVSESIRQGEVELIVGTHAVLGDDIEFHRLGLVVIDEQHKFGVHQRARLKQGDASNAHYLVMTATPIPRTVSMTVFGDLDISSLRDGPANRQPVHTYVGGAAREDSWWEFFGRKVREGRQGYVVTPLVEENEELEVSGVEQVFEQLANGRLAGFRLDLIHGRMSAAEKDQVMKKFERGDTQVLVATSVIEVGIDVPNATMMTILSGERFGLAQLHQLRGRVTRGHFPGYVCVFADKPSDEAEKRLAALCETASGFDLAEIDFQLRGPGDIFGTRQHGLPPLRIADVQRDQDILAETRRDAQHLVAQGDAFTQDSSFERLRTMVIRRYGQVLDLGDVG